jgi:uncharacterized repeat protein (TIGR01451 family)
MAGEQFLGGDVTGDGVSDVDITNAGDFTVVNGVTFTDAVRVGSGTGGYNTFLAISNNSGVESGFNSDDTPPLDGTNGDIDQAKTHTVQLSSLVVTTINGVQYYQIRIDLNEANSDPNAQLSLDQFRLYTSTNGGIESTTALFNPANATLKYDMDAGGNKSILLSDAGSTGSGTDDYSILIPVSVFAGADPATTYLYVYAQMGAAGTDWMATSTFEEFNLENGVTLSGVKFNDANGNGVRDAGEAGIGGVTIFIDSNQNGALDVGERTTVTASDGSYSFFGVALNQTLWIDESMTGLPVGTVQTTGAHETVTISANAAPGSTIIVDPIGNFLPNPALNVTKAVSSVTGGTGGSADSAGDVINYVIDLQNTGNVQLTGITVTDPNATGGVQAVLSGGFNSGDVDHDNILDVGETWHYTATHTVTQAELDGKGIDSTGAIDGDGDDDNTVTADSNETGPDTASASAPLTYAPSLNIVKDVTSITGGQGTNGLNGADSAGDVINYSITVQNTGNVTLTGITVTDPNATTGPTYVSGDTDSDGKLDVGETWTYTATHTVTQAELDNQGGGDGDVDNIATADSNETGPDTDPAEAPLIYSPSFNIVKDVSSVTGGDADGKVDSAGDIINYVMTVQNTGNVTLTGVSVTDPYATTGPTYQSGDTDGDGKLDVGETWTYTATHTVTQAEIDSDGAGDGNLENTATAHSNETPDDSDDAEVPIAFAPNINIIKDVTSITGGQGTDGLTGADSAGDVIHYAITVQNTGNVSLTNVVVTDPNADSGSIQEVTSGGFNVGDTDMDGQLDTNEQWSYTATHTVTQDELDNRGGGDNDVDNTATADSDQAGPDTDNAEAPLIYAPGLDIEKDVASITGGQGAGGLDGADSAGDVINYSITVDNTGNITLTNVTVTDPNADLGSIAYVSGDTDADGKLDVNETWTYSATHTVTQAELDSQGGGDGDVDNTATADSTETGPDTDDATAPLIYNPALNIAKDVSSITGGQGTDGLTGADSAGDVINYTISVQNTGNITLTNVTVTDPNADVGSITYVSGDTDTDGKLDVGETWQYTAAHTVTQAELDNQGGGDGDVDNTATADSTETGPDTDDATAPLIYNPALNIVKDVSSITGGQGTDGLTGADSAGDVINYTISVQNTGNVSLTNVSVTDPNADAGTIQQVVSGAFNVGDTNTDGVLSVGETWQYTAQHTVTQAELDNQGGGDGDVDNTATADSTETGPDTDDATAPLIYNPAIDITKYVDVGFGWDDANSGPGPQNVNVGADVEFQITLHNTGNVTLTDVDLTDTNNSNGTIGTPNLLIDDGVVTQFGIDHGAVLTGDTGNDHVLSVGETWTVTYTAAFDPGDHLNTADASTAEGATDEDSAFYFSLVNLGPCPRTPGFWQNMKNGGLFWDGVAGNEHHAGDHDFPDGELLYAVDSNHDGVINGSDKAGLLIGDYNGNGLTDAGEDTLFVNYADARSLINASNKQVNGLSGDGKFMLGRDMVAAWLNYEMGAGFGDASDPQSPTSLLNDAIDFMQIYGGKTAGGLNETFDEFVLSGPIKASSNLWKVAQPGVDHSGSALHSGLDYYNNTGMTRPGGTLYANCGDDFVNALNIYEAAHGTATTTSGMMSLSSLSTTTTSSAPTLSAGALSMASHPTLEHMHALELGTMTHSFDLIGLN